MPTRTKKLVNLTLRCSDPFRAAVRAAAELLPEARAKAGPWAETTARGEWDLIRNALREIDDPALWNDFIQSWSLPGRTARQKLHALKFRLQAYRHRDSLPVH